MTKVAVILSGCGYLDGAEIRESVLTLYALEKQDIKYEIFAPDIKQYHVVNHLTGQENIGQTRNVLEEASRIARGKISTITKLNSSDFDALVIPGGFGIAKNFSDIALASDLTMAEAVTSIKEVILSFYDTGKPIVAICIAPALVALALRDRAASLDNESKPHLTLGEASNSHLVEASNCLYVSCDTEEYCFDERHKLISCSAYMRDDSLLNVASGIEGAILKLSNILSE